MKTISIAQPTLLRHKTPEQCDFLDELLVHTLHDTEFDFGRLHFPESLEEECPDFIEELPPCLKGCEGNYYHEIDLVFHPRGGAVILGECSLPRGMPRGFLRAEISDTHNALVALQRKIRRRLNDDPYWRDRPIILGMGIIIRGAHIESDIPDNTPREIVIGDEDLDELPERLDHLFEFFETPSAIPAANYGDRLVQALTQSAHWMGSFQDQAHLVNFYNDLYERFDFDPRAA